jgi:hypothetical protein
MKTIELWRWWISGPTGKRRQTRYVMTAEDALKTDPNAERVEGSLEQRQVADDHRLDLPNTDGTGPPKA